MKTIIEEVKVGDLLSIRDGSKRLAFEVIEIAKLFFVTERGGCITRFSKECGTIEKTIANKHGFNVHYWVNK